MKCDCCEDKAAFDCRWPGDVKTLCHDCYHLVVGHLVAIGEVKPSQVTFHLPGVYKAEKEYALSIGKSKASALDEAS